MFQDDFHDWRVIPLFLIGKKLRKNFKFHNNIDINNDILSKFLSFHQDVLIKLKNNYTAKPNLPSMALSEFIWFNSNIKISSKLVHFSFFFWQELKLCRSIVWWQWNIKSWKDIKYNFILTILIKYTCFKLLMVW